MNKEPEEAEVIKTDAVAVVKNPPPAPIENKPPMTASQAKIEAIADLTHSAYQKAATLQLTKDESDLLRRDFPDEAFKPGAGGNSQLLYIEHAFLRDRFIEVFGMGQWAIIPRRTWNESFQTGRGTAGERVYVEAMLVVRGCFVAEAVGAMEYYPKNESQNYGDAVEGAKTAAFRRCAKEFGVGLQAWKKDWCDSWWARKRVQKAPGAIAKPQVAPVHPPTAPKPRAEAKMPTPATRLWMMNQLHANPGASARQIVTEYFRKCSNPSQLLPNEEIEELPLRFVPFSKDELEALCSCIANFEAGGDAVAAFAPHGEAEEPPKPEIEVPRDLGEPGTAGGTSEDAWRTFPMPWGKQAGVPLEDLEKNYLYGLWANYTVETEYKGKPKKPETIEKDQEFRAMLDLAGKHYEFVKKD